MRGGARLEIPAPGALDCQRGEDTGPIGARINADPVRLLLDFVANRVPMDDDAAVIGVVEQERLPNPAQIGLQLFLDADPWPNPRVDEQIVTEAAGIGEAVEELAVLGGNCIADRLERLVIAQLRELRGLDAIAAEAFRTPEPPPLRDQRGLAVENAKQDLLVIAEQEDRSDAFFGKGAEPFDDLRGVGAAIDQVAQKHQKRLSRRPFSSVMFNLAEQLLEEIEAAMDVSDYVSSVAAGTFWLGLIDPHEVEDAHSELKRDLRL